MREWKRVLVGIIGSGALLVSGCRSTQSPSHMPSVIQAETHIHVRGFECDNLELARSFSDSLAEALGQGDRFTLVTRGQDPDEGIVVFGRIREFRKGSVPARIKFGPAIGNARLAVEVSVADSRSEEVLARFTVDKSTLLTGPDAGKTGRESFDWLLREVSKQVAERISR